jgi:hypothetical protein
MSGLAWKAGLLGRTAAHPAPLGSDGARARNGAAPPPPAEIDVVAQSPVEAPRGAGAASASGMAPSEGASVPPLVALRSATGTAGGATTRATLDASNGRPGLGQPVDFVARIPNARSRVEGARFQFSGPGLAGSSEVPASDDGGGAYRTTFTFLQPGRFDVRFSARADGAPVSVVRSVVVGDVGGPGAAAAAPHATPEATPAPAAPTATGKWL